MNALQNKTFRSLSTIVLSCIISLGLLVAGFKNPHFGTSFVTRASYYIILLMVGFWIFQINRCLSAEKVLLKNFLKKARVSLLFSLLMTSVVFISLPPKYRVLSDETNLLSVSQSMSYRKDILNVTQAKFYYGNFNYEQGDLPTRPLLFPFLTHLVHTITGYHYQNVFVLNFIILFCLLTLTFLVIESQMGRMSAIAACLLLLSIPALTLSASSGGFDLCSLFFFALSFVLLYRFLIRPTNENFGMLLIQLIMLSQVRYESIAYVALILGVLLTFRKITLEMITQNTSLLSVVPLFLLPMLIQRKLTPNTFENPPGVAPFAFSHFLKHGKELLEGMIFFRPEYPYPSYLNLLAIVCLTFILIKVLPGVRKYWSSSQILFAGILAGSVLLSLLIVLFHHFGVFAHPTQARLFLVFLAGLALMPVVMRAVLPKHLPEKGLLVISLTSFVLYHPVASESRFTNSLTIVRETEEDYRYLKELNDPNILIVAERPGQLTVANYGAVGFGYANGNKDSIMDDLNRGLFSDVVIFQKCSYETGKPLKDQTLDPIFKPQYVKDVMISTTEFVRVSKAGHTPYPIQPEKIRLTRSSALDDSTKLNPKFKKMLANIKFK